MNRTKLLRIACLFALAGAGCSSPTDSSGSGGAIEGAGGTGIGGTGIGGTGVGGEGIGGQGLGGQGLGGAGLGGAGIGGNGQGIGGQGIGGQGIGGQGLGGRGTGGAGTGGAPAEPTLVTSASGAYWRVGSVTEVTTGTAEVTVNDASVSQTWDGFGGAFNELGWQYLMTLSQADRDMALRLLFGPDGCRFTFGRIPIGASDYAVSRYTLNETAGDYAMANFSINRDKERLIPFVQAALAVKPDIRLWASPWTPPTWMKNSPFQAGNVVSPFDGGTMKTDAQTLQAFALYLAKFVQEYGKLGITIEAVAPQNEPNYGQNYPSALWAASTYSTFIGTHMGPTFASQNVTAQIILGTMSNPDAGKDPSVLSTTIANTTALGYIKGFGLQWGMLSSVSGLRSRNLPIMQTEHKCGNYPWEGGYVSSAAPNNQAYAVETWGLIRDWIKAGVTSYSAWNMVLDRVGKGIDTTRDWAQNALLVVNAGTLTQTPAFHVFRHFSQFVDPGARVVATTGGDALAFKNPDGTIVAVIYNSGAAKTSIVSVAGRRLQFSMPGAGWATVNWK